MTSPDILGASDGFAIPQQASPGILEKLTEIILRVTTGGIVLIVLLQVIGRLINRPVSWSEELTRALFIWMIFIGMAAGMRHADSARVTVCMEYMPQPLRRLALPVYIGFSLAFFSLMAWTGVILVKQQVTMNESSATLGWPSWVIGIVIPTSAILAAVLTIVSLKDHRAAIALSGSPAP